MSDENIFAVPLKVEDVADCYFYHTMELPGYGVIEGRDWDLRGGVDEYLGKVDFAGQRVLEIGPASGFLTFEMEKRGAQVVSVEVTAEHGWDFVPYPAARLEEVFGPRRIVMQQLKNSYWFSHAAHTIQSQSVLRRCLQFACRPRGIRHRSDGFGPVTLPRSAPDRRAMRENRRNTHHCGHVSAGIGRRACLPSRAQRAEFPLAYLVEFQHAIFHPVSCGDGIHHFRNFAAPAVSPRKTVHAVHCRRSERMRNEIDSATCACVNLGL